MSWQLLQGDCREVLRSLAPDSVDAVVADPPYGETSLEWDRRVDGWLPEVRRVLKPTGSLWCCGSLRFFMERAVDFAGWALVQDVVWEKHNGSNSAADRFRRVHELVAQFRPADRPWEQIYRCPQTTADARRRQIRRKRRPAHWGEIGAGFYVSEDGGPRLQRSVLAVRSCHGYAVHRTQKPVDLLLPLVRYSCPPGGTVLDPFAGSGSTGLAAAIAGCHFIGIELDAEAAAMAARRLAGDVRGDAPLLAHVRGAAGEPRAGAAR